MKLLSLWAVIGSLLLLLGLHQATATPPHLAALPTTALHSAPPASTLAAAAYANSATAKDAQSANALTEPLTTTVARASPAPLASADFADLSLSSNLAPEFIAVLENTNALLSSLQTSTGTPANVQAQIDALQHEISQTNQINNLADVTITSPSFSGVTTSNIPEGSNLYFTDARVDQELEATSSLGSLLAAPNLTTVSTGLTGFLQATAGVLSTALVNLTSNVTGILPVANGGTGLSSVAAGFIPFGNGSSAIATSSGLYWNNTTGNLGIGTSSPYTQLTVPGYTTPSEIAATSTGLSNPVALFVAQNNYAYVTDQGTNSLVIFDISNPASPTEVASISTPSPFGVTVQGRYAYVVSQSSSKLSIFDISNPASPVQVGVTSTGLSSALAVYVQGRYAYVTSYSNSSVVIFDISNPASPTKVGSVAFPNASAITVQGRYAYVANQGTTAGIIDISDPANPVVVSTFTVGSHPNGIEIQGRYLYISGFFGGSIQVFDVSNPAAPVLVGAMSAGLTNPNGFTVQGHYLYAANSYTLANSHLVVFDVSNPAEPVEVGSVSTGLNNPQTVRVLGHYAYVVSSANASLVVFDLGGSYIQQLETGGLEASTLNVRNNLQAADGAFSGGLTVGNNANIAGSLDVTASTFNATTTAEQSYSIFSVNTASSTSPLLTTLYNGNVGIGTSTPYSRLTLWGPDTASTSAFLIANSASTTEFDVFDNGNATLAGSLTQNSDQRLKTNIQSLDASSSLSLIDQLNPVTFNWIDPEKGTEPQLGFIAQQVLPIFPNLIATTSPTALTPDGTLSLNYIGLISPIVSAIQELDQQLSSIASAITGFADSFTTNDLTYTRATGADLTLSQELCIDQSDGTPVCVTGDQLAAVLAATSVPQAPEQESGGSLDSDADTTAAASDTPPVIQINGDNPATVQIGDTYSDLGATITGPEQDLNLGIQTFVNGIQSSSVEIDTSAAATDTIQYVATDQNGLTSTSTRMVIVEAPSIAATDDASTTDATTTDATTTAQ